MTQSQIRCFLAAAETLSFTKAAELCYYVPQSVSKNIKAMETELGAVLFERLEGGLLRLTGAGEYYRAVFARAAGSYAEMQENIRRREQLRNRSLRIVFSNRVDAMREINAVLAGFQESNPDVALSALQGEVRPVLQSGAADVGIILTKHSNLGPNFQLERIVREKEKLVVSAWAKAAMAADKVDPRCWDLPYLAVHESECSHLESFQQARRLLEQHGLRPERIELLPNEKSVIATTMLIACVTISGERFDFLSHLDQCKSFEIPICEPEPWLCCVWNKFSENTVLPRFVSHMKEALNSEG